MTTSFSFLLRTDNGTYNFLFWFYFEDGKTKVKVIAGESIGAKAVIDTQTPIMYLDIHVQAGGTFVQDVHEEYNGFAYVWRGAGSFTEEKISVEMGKVNFLEILTLLTENPNTLN